METHGAVQFGKKDKRRRTSKKGQLNLRKLCPTCKELFRVGLTGSRRFCSDDCRNEFFKTS